MTNAQIEQLEGLNDSIYVFYKPPDGHWKSEIIFVHDIQQSESDGLHLRTWISSSKSTERSVCWPKYWLSEKFPEARILSARHYGAVWKTNTSGDMDLHLIAENLWQDILEIYKEGCPVFLVGHGLGGLIITAIVHLMEDRLSTNASGEKEKKMRCLLENVEGVFFYNTPFQGIELADHTPIFSRKSSLTLETLPTLNEKTQRSNDWFSKWRKFRCRTGALYASCRTNAGLWYTAREASVRYDTDEFYTPSGSDHSNVCQPRDETDSRFQKLVQFLKMPRLLGNSGPAVEDSLEIESSRVLNKILCDVRNVPEGGGLFVSLEELENIKRFPDKWNRLLECFRECRLEMTDINSECELWTRLPADEPMSEES